MIKSNWNLKVKILLLCAFSISHGLADELESQVEKLESNEYGVGAPSAQTQQQLKRIREVEKSNKNAISPTGINLIEAEDFAVKLLKTSSSKRVLLLSTSEENPPRPGKILLLKAGDQNIAAVRVLKHYSGKIAVKNVLPFSELSPGLSYRALKKIADKMIEMIRERERVYGDLDSGKSDAELAKEVSPNDAELDRGIPAPGVVPTPSPAPIEQKKKKASEELPPPLFDKEGNDLTMDDIEIQNEDEPFEEVSVQEFALLEPLNHIVSVQYASIRGINKANVAQNYNAVGIRYGLNAFREVLLKRRNFQDMLTLELGFFYYTVLGFEKTTDEYALLPVIGTLRYSLLFSETLSIFGYLGVNKSNVISSNDDRLTSASRRLSFTKAAAGAGIFFKLGPAWAIRADFGTDMFGVGASLKF